MPSLGRHLVVNLDEVRKKERGNVGQTWTDGNTEVIAFLRLPLAAPCVGRPSFEKIRAAPFSW